MSGSTSTFGSFLILKTLKEVERREEVPGSQGPKVGPRVPGANFPQVKGPKVHRLGKVISRSQLITSLTLKKVHLVKDSRYCVLILKNF